MGRFRAAPIALHNAVTYVVVVIVLRAPCTDAAKSRDRCFLSVLLLLPLLSIRRGRRIKCSVMLGLRCRRVNETIDTHEDRSVLRSIFGSYFYRAGTAVK